MARKFNFKPIIKEMTHLIFIKLNLKVIFNKTALFIKVVILPTFINNVFFWNELPNP